MPQLLFSPCFFPFALY
uniref:Uncharacterized protein n=1 Tax=Arundo donax TaxID=35708 RepID=A0A0A8ZAE2_ARUDO